MEKLPVASLGFGSHLYREALLKVLLRVCKYHVCLFVCFFFNHNASPFLFTIKQNHSPGSLFLSSGQGHHHFWGEWEEERQKKTGQISLPERILK